MGNNFCLYDIESKIQKNCFKSHTIDDPLNSQARLNKEYYYNKNLQTKEVAYNIKNQSFQKQSTNQKKEKIAESNLIQEEQKKKSEYQRTLEQFSIGCFAENESFNHFYENKKSNNISARKTKKILQEIKLLKKNLPVNQTNSIFVKYDEKHIDLMKILIAGAEDTPYSHGIFEFDVYFDDNYPNKPPLMNLITTGGNSVRFNPNLYKDGFICLSLLGTWSGNGIENWNSESSLLQILLSIQSIVMSEDVYFNEPGFQSQKSTTRGQQLNKAYQNIVKLCNIKYAMISQLENPISGFESIIKQHFRIKKSSILKTCQEWLKDAKNNKLLKDVQYGDLVLSHNFSWCNKLKKNDTAYYNCLKKEVEILKKLLNKI